MKAKEKAEQLVNSFYYALPNNGSSTGLNSTTIRFKEATVCALIAVDEILKVAFYAPNEIYEHYIQVKQEIENIGGDK